MVNCVKGFWNVSDDYANYFVVLIVNSGNGYDLIEGSDGAVAFSAAMMVFIYDVISV